MKNSKTKKIVESALMLGLSTLLSLISVFKMPLGGSVTLLSMLPVCLISLKYGVKHGLFVSFVYSLLQLFTGLGALMGCGLTPKTLAGSVVFDYIAAFSILGISGIFGKNNIKNIFAGICLAMFLRFVSHFISGTIFFAVFCPEGWNAALYSVCYNGAYMLPEAVFTALGASLLFKAPQIFKMLSE